MNSLENASPAAHHHQLRSDDRTSLEVKIHTMDAVLDIATTLGRVGAKIVAISAFDLRVRITFEATDFVSKRLPSLLETIIQVDEVLLVDQVDPWIALSE